MRMCETTVNFRLSCVVTMATCLLCSHLPFSSGLKDSQVPSKGNKLSKRDVFMGLELQCKFHARNCPGGLKKRGRSYLLENLRQLLPASYDRKSEELNSISDSLPDSASLSSSSSSLSSSSSSSSSDPFSSALSPGALEGLALYSNEDKLNRDLIDFLTSSSYGDSERRRTW